MAAGDRHDRWVIIENLGDNMRSPISAILAFLVGAVVLAGYFTASPILNSIRTPLLDWAVTLAGVAGLIAIANLVFGVHLKRIRSKAANSGFSFVLIIAFSITFVAGLFLGPSHPEYQKVVTGIQVPIEASLMGLLAITLAYSSLKFLQRQHNWMGFVFFIAVLFFLVINSGLLSFSTDIPILRDIVSGAHQLPVGGARGILLGVALGSLATGIRIMIGADRPYNN